VSRHDPAGGQPPPRPDEDQPDIPREVVIDRLPLDRLEEVDLGRVRAPEIAVEQVDHDLARELPGRHLLVAAFELENMRTGQNERLPGRAVDDRSRAVADGVGAEHPDPDHGLGRVGVGEGRLGGFGLLLRAIVRVVPAGSGPGIGRFLFVAPSGPVDPPRPSPPPDRGGIEIVACADMGVGVARGLGLGLGGQVEPLEDGRRLKAARAVELTARAVDHDESRDGVDVVALGQSA
jgi:hypothetical protein